MSSRISTHRHADVALDKQNDRACRLMRPAVGSLGLLGSIIRLPWRGQVHDLVWREDNASLKHRHSSGSTVAAQISQLGTATWGLTHCTPMGIALRGG